MPYLSRFTERSTFRDGLVPQKNSALAHREKKYWIASITEQKKIARCTLVLHIATALLCCIVSPCFGQSVNKTQRTLIITNPSTIDLSDSESVERLLEMPIDRIVVPCFVEGFTIFPSSSGIFSQMAEYKGKGDILQSLIERAHSRKIKVCGFIQCFRWGRPGTSNSQSPLVQHPELAEQVAESALRPTGVYGYASPFNQDVQRHLITMLREITTRYPIIDGFVLRCQMPQSPLLAYNEGSRATYIRAAGIDPLDISVSESSTDTEGRELASPWINWRLTQLAKLVKTMSKVIKSSSQSKKVAVIGYPLWYQYPQLQRNSSMNDYLTWASQGSIDEILYEARWEGVSNKDGFRIGTSLLERANLAPSVTTAAVVSFREGKVAEADGVNALTSLAGQGIKHIVVSLPDKADISMVSKFWLETLPKFEKEMRSVFEKTATEVLPKSP